MIPIRLATVVIMVLASAVVANAAALRDCDGSVDRVSNVVDPVHDNVKTFMVPRFVRLARVSTGGEPVAASEHAVIDVGSEIDVACYLLSATQDGAGFYQVHIEGAFAVTEREQTSLFVPVQTYPYATDQPTIDVELRRIDIGADAVRLVR